MGSGWDKYGLSATDYSAQRIQAVLDGYDPQSGEQLIKGMVDIQGNSKRVPGYDLTFSADKSVSVVFAAGDESTKQKIIDAQNQAVARTVRYIEENSLTANVGKGGKDRCKSKLFASGHNHATSRAGDPDLHTHVVLANFVQREDGKIMSLNARDLMNRQKEFGAIYRAELARQMATIGFTVEKHGHENEFMRIAGSPKEIEKFYSKRRTEIEASEEQIKAAMEKYGVSRARAAEWVALDTRHDKEAISIEDIKKQWHEELKGMGFDQSHIDQMLKSKLTNKPEKPEIDANAILERVTAMNSVFSEKTFRETFVNQAVGVLSVDEIETQYQGLLKSPTLIKCYRTSLGEDGQLVVKNAFTTQTMVDLDNAMIAEAKALKSATTHAIDRELVTKQRLAYQARKGFELTADQIVSLEMATIQSNLTIIEGHAGTGKTTAIEVAANAWREAGLKVIGCAPSGKAANGLLEVGIDSVTIAKLLLQNKSWQDDQGVWHQPTKPLTSHDVIVMDEAGMVGTRDMKAVLEAAQAVGAKVVLMGDRKQLQSVAAGGALRALIEKVGLDSALTSVQRQKNDDIKNVVANSRNGDIAQSLDLLDRKGGLHLVDDKQAGVAQVIDSWKRHYDHNSPRAAETSVMLANTNIDVEKLNGFARAYLKQVGALKGIGSEIEVSDRDGISLGKKEFLANDRIVFLKNTTFGEGQQKQSVKNGQTARILAINGTALKIQLDNGKHLVCDITTYNNLSHAYAITTHKSQGITVDHAAILGGGFMQSLNQTYVQLSRVRHDVDFVLPKNEIERLMVAVEPTKKMHELAAKIAESKGHDLESLNAMNFLETRNYLNEHADFSINGTPETSKGRWRREIGDLLDRMGQTVEKENTFDYVIETKQQEDRVIEVSM